MSSWRGADGNPNQKKGGKSVKGGRRQSRVPGSKGTDDIWKDEEVFTGNSDDEDEDNGYDSKHPHHRHGVVPNFGSYPARKHHRKPSHSASNNNAAYNPALPDIVNMSSAAAIAYQQHIYEGELPVHGLGGSLGGGVGTGIDGTGAFGASGGGAYGMAPPGTAPIPTIADMDIDEQAWRVADNMALKSVSLAGFEDDTPGATGG